VGRNNPQKCPYGLYAEQLSGTAFTAPRHRNQRSWLYRIRPSVLHTAFVPLRAPDGEAHSWELSWSTARLDPNQMRWAPAPLLPTPAPAVATAPYREATNDSSTTAASVAASNDSRDDPAGAAEASAAPAVTDGPNSPNAPPGGGGSGAVDFLASLVSMVVGGDPVRRQGTAIHMYNCNGSMVDSCLVDADGDLLIVPDTGVLTIRVRGANTRRPSRLGWCRGQQHPAYGTPPTFR
jgi:homogentisate 1,2-dioxygenase